MDHKARPKEVGVENGKVPVRAVHRAVDVLMELTNGPQTLGALARTTGLSKATTHRLLTTLTHRRMVMQDGQTGLYSLGTGCFRIVEAMKGGHTGLGAIALPTLERLARESGETATLHVRFGDQRLCVEEVPSMQAVRYTAGRGATAPIHAGSAGKVLLAFLDDGLRNQVVQSLTLSSVTELTVVDAGALLMELELARRQGWAISRGERIKGAAAVTAPVFDSTGAVVAALSVLGPESRLDTEGLAAARPLVLDAAHELTAIVSMSGSRDSEEVAAP
jgi:DNA-binding IclR family transcriptional regulator